MNLYTGIKTGPDPEFMLQVALSQLQPLFGVVDIRPTPGGKRSFQTTKGREQWLRSRLHTRCFKSFQAKPSYQLPATQVLVSLACVPITIHHDSHRPQDPASAGKRNKQAKRQARRRRPRRPSSTQFHLRHMQPKRRRSWRFCHWNGGHRRCPVQVCDAIQPLEPRVV